MMPGKTLRKGALPTSASSTRTESEVVAECALQLRMIGDKWNLRQMILNMISKIFCPGRGE
ncbi:phorbol-12-myristate-13-acetate-induced protein 1 [Anolis sagrei]|uniref:phorbol-12-myristate-13-acetate-induced protein 1 n=1 Tax=Anolis sagrei TaxID=38937 RepID=UPI00295C1492|nr:phorbol-12-myristate-13-acetate-induced protein 1 [Anolis sagrei ordinatus]